MVSNKGGNINVGNNPDKKKLSISVFPVEIWHRILDIYSTSYSFVLMDWNVVTTYDELTYNIVYL